MHSDTPLALAAGRAEHEVLDELRALAARNQVLTSMIGLGYHGTVTPPVILRNVLESPAWYTAYTPYQPEISQGRLEALLNFQTVVTDLTGLPVAGASLLDEATAAAEAMTLAGAPARRRPARVFVVDTDVLPQTLAVIQTRAEPLGLEVVVADLHADGLPDRDLFGVLLQYPGATGAVRDLTSLVSAAKERGAVVAVAADLLALTLLRSPAELGADIAVGTSQRFGVPMGFGGPHAGYMSVRKGLERQMPGRLVGVSKDVDGHPAYRLALQTREQHIRREKATSNICTAQVLLAVVAGMYAVYHGPDGLRAIARRTHSYAAALAAGLRSVEGVEIVHDAFFDTVLARTPGRADAVVAAARERGVNLRLVDADHVGITTDETTTREHLAAVWTAFGAEADESDADRLAGEDRLPAEMLRHDEVLTHPVFHAHRSETAMLRYLRKLSDRDLALDRSMIPLGSCTMKLNATAEMEPITWPEFAAVHPFAPVEQAAGYLELIDQLESWLCEVTGYDAVSLQPNAGSQGELSGLLAIRAYHRANGQQARNVCLIPSSAHGTNAASAVMAGMKVVVVKTADGGDVDLDDLRAKVEEHRDDLAAIMVTYPSTHGVFEQDISELCALVHEAGGQVYVDGANLNALVGVARPGALGFRRVAPQPAQDVLHPTWWRRSGCRPGRCSRTPRAVPAQPPDATEGRPGVRCRAGVGGAVGVGRHPADLVDLRPADGRRGADPGDEVAILNANYVAARLGPALPGPVHRAAGLVAHECIVDLRPITKDTGVTVDDVAKRSSTTASTRPRCRSRWPAP